MAAVTRHINNFMSVCSKFANSFGVPYAYAVIDFVPDTRKQPVAKPDKALALVCSNLGNV